MEEGTTAHGPGGKCVVLMPTRNAMRQLGYLIDSGVPHRLCRLPRPQASLFVGEGANSRMEVVHKDDTLVSHGQWS